MTVGSLVSIARSRLGDDRQQRWTDNRLLAITNQGQANICKLTGIYRKEVFISLANGLTRYKLPTDCMTIRRLEYRGERIVLYTRDDLDSGKQDSNAFVGLKDNIGMGWLDIYPTLDTLESDVLIIRGIDTYSDFSVQPIYGVVTSIDSGFVVDPTEGVVTGIDYEYNVEVEEPTVFGELTSSPLHSPPTMNFNPNDYGVTISVAYEFSTDPKLFGFISDSKSKEYEVSGQYGVITTIIPKENALRLFYEAVPTGLSSMQTALVIPDMWEEAMVRYIVGTALQDDNDANNIQRGEMELQKYASEVSKARELSSKDFSGGTKEKYHTGFRRI